MTAIDRLIAADQAYRDAKAALDEARAEVLRLSRETHATTFKTDQATVSVSRRRQVDCDAFVAFCEKASPEAVVTTKTVSDAFKKAWLDRLRWTGEGWVTEDGEEVDFVRDSAPYVSVRLS